jgi:hypothetical protein
VVVVDEFLLVSGSEPSYFSMLIYMSNIPWWAGDYVSVHICTCKVRLQLACVDQSASISLQASAYNHLST